jgi:pimeloyl-ACP methyl ester carboxylesterase
LRRLASFLAVATLAYVAGPRPRLGLRRTPSDSSVAPGASGEALPWRDPLALAERVAAREAAQPIPVTPDAEACVRWGAAAGERTPVAFVYLHGFTATRQEIEPVMERVADTFRANTFYARLHGHGQGRPGIEHADARRWLDEAREALQIGRALGDRVVLIGSSTGATLALWVALEAESTEVATSVDALVLVSPNFGLRHPAARLLVGPWGRAVARIVQGSERQALSHGAEHERFWTLTYPVEAVIQVLLVVAQARAQKVERLRAPVLLLHHPEDPVVSPRQMRSVFRRLRDPRSRIVDLAARVPDGDRHVIAGRIRSPARVDAATHEILRYLRPILPTPPPPEPPVGRSPTRQAGSASQRKRSARISGNSK